ncbi:hypothetical protein OBBRIDRAFT_840046 [Obba rivulosa]|uniref:Uncharacterized protein n=1 Tax=Obba rivulosa TaxID=1052685 RepID=A0A8E2DDQ9_9APHY|nr:hypothetical protein OBBRIDRAFT_840046 [Obba rivulosa]
MSSEDSSSFSLFRTSKRTDPVYRDVRPRSGTLIARRANDAWRDMTHTSTAPRCCSPTTLLVRRTLESAPRLFYEGTEAMVYNLIVKIIVQIFQTEAKSRSITDGLPRGEAAMVMVHRSHYRTDDRSRTWRSFQPVLVSKPLSLHSDTTELGYIFYQATNAAAKETWEASAMTSSAATGEMFHHLCDIFSSTSNNKAVHPGIREKKRARRRRARRPEDVRSLHSAGFHRDAAVHIGGFHGRAQPQSRTRQARSCMPTHIKPSRAHSRTGPSSHKASRMRTATTGATLASRMPCRYERAGGGEPPRDEAALDADRGRRRAVMELAAPPADDKGA